MPTSTPCTIANQSGSWISSVARGSAGVHIPQRLLLAYFQFPPNVSGKCWIVWRCNWWFSNVNATNATTIKINAYSNVGTSLAR